MVYIVNCYELELVRKGIIYVAVGEEKGDVSIEYATCNRRIGRPVDLRIGTSENRRIGESENRRTAGVVLGKYPTEIVESPTAIGGNECSPYITPPLRRSATMRR
jgi:hypothetical protein